MAEFTGNTDVKAMDLLTLIVMLDTCDVDQTIVTFWKEGTTFTQYDRQRVVRPPPTQHTWCLACCIKTASRTRVENKAELIEAVKSGWIQITMVGQRDDINHCKKCRQLPKVNKLWLDELQR